MGVKAKMLKKGLCGGDLKQQVTVIALTYCGLSILMICVGFLLFLHPHKFIHIEDNVDSSNIDIGKVDVDTDHISTENQAISLTEGLDKDANISRVTLPAPLKYEDEETIMDSSEEIELNEDIVIQQDDSPKENLKSSPHYSRLIKNVRDEGMEAIVGSFLKLVCSIVLFHGIRKNKHILFLPWLAEETIELVFGTVLFFMETIQRQWDVTGATFFLIVNIIGGYFLYSTASYYNILRRRNINSSIVVQSVSQAEEGGGFQNGMNYQRLDEECWQSEPNLTSEIRNKTRGIENQNAESGFRREKKIF